MVSFVCSACGPKQVCPACLSRLVAFQLACSSRRSAGGHVLPLAVSLARRAAVIAARQQ